MLWSFNGDDDRTDHKIWFDCRRLATTGNYYESLLDICAQNCQFEQQIAEYKMELAQILF